MKYDLYNKFLLTTQDYLKVTTATHTEKSNVTCLQVTDAVADNRDTTCILIYIDGVNFR